MQTIVDDKISVMFCSGIRICIHKPLRLFSQNYSGHGYKLTLVFQVSKHNVIVSVEFNSAKTFTLVEHVLYYVKFGYITVM